MLKWSMELGELGIRYIPRIAIKAQALADFISELTLTEDNSSAGTEQRWALYMDGSTNIKRGVSLILKGPDGQ